MRRFRSRRPRHHARRSLGTARPIATVFFLVAIAISGGIILQFNRVLAQPADAAADPFAHELHPLRRRAEDQAAATGLLLAPTPSNAVDRLPVPFPEATTPTQEPSDGAAPASPADRAEEYLQQALEARRRGDLERSVEVCSQGLSIMPDHPELLLRRGIAWFHLGMNAIAAEDFADAAGIAYDDPRPELWRGLTAIERGQPLEAVSAYSEAIRRDRTYLLAYLNRGLAYLHAGEAEKAVRDFDHAIRHDPRDARAWFHRGVAATRQRRFLEAVRAYETALRLDPDHEPARRNLAALRRQITPPPHGNNRSPSSLR
jgi:tetratricopeptide (TPR) repeat protein